jgi:uncharacterized DUF497 family protein
VEVLRLLWDRSNRAKLASHGVSEEDATDMILVVNEWVADVRDNYPDQIRVIGPTEDGRFLTVALQTTAEPDLWRPVTGWHSSSEDIAYYREERP